MAEISCPYPEGCFEALMLYLNPGSWDFDREPQIAYSEEEKSEIRKQDKRLYGLFLRLEGKIPLEEFTRMKKSWEEDLNKDIEERVSEFKDSDIKKYKESQLELKVVSYIGSTPEEFKKNLKNHVEYCISCLKNYLNYLSGFVETEFNVFSAYNVNPRERLNLRERIMDLDSTHLTLFTPPETD